MNGIFGYIGKSPCTHALANALEGLKKYGTDFASVVAKSENEFVPMCDDTLSCTICIAQCAGASRAKEISPNFNKLFCTALGNEIVNFDAIKSQFIAPQKIETDNDLMLAMLCVFNEQDYRRLAIKSSDIAQNRPEFIFAPSDENAIYCSAGNGELIIGMDKNGNCVCNDFDGIIGNAEKNIVISNGEFAKITIDKVIVFDSKLRKIKKTARKTPMPKQSKMLSIPDDLLNCPVAIKNVYASMTRDNELNLDYLKLNKKRLEHVDKIIIFGEGDAYNSAKIGENALKMLCDISSYSYPSCELLSSYEIVTKNTIMIAIDNGNSNDNTIKCVTRFKQFGARIIGIVQNEHCPLARKCDSIICTNSPANGGTLNSFLSASYAMLLLSLHIGEKNRVVSQLYTSVTLKMAEMLSGKISAAIKSTPTLERFANTLISYGKAYFVGQNTDYAIAARGAEALRSIAGINSNAHYTGQLILSEKALNGALIIAPITTKESLSTNILYLNRAKIRGAKILIITSETIAEELTDFDCVAEFSDSVPLFNPLICSCVMHKIALLSADVDSKASAIDKVS